MSAPVLKIEMVLDGSTGNSTNWTDVTSQATDSANVSRGRSRETDQFTTGTATFTLRNESGNFDPHNSAGAYYPYVVPRIKVRIHLATSQIFYGFVDDIQPNYVKPAISTVTFTCIDGLGLLASTMLQAKTVSDQSPGARLATILADSHVAYSETSNVVGLSQTVVGFSGLNAPSGVAVDGAGNLYVTDAANNRVVKWDGTTQTVLPTTGLPSPTSFSAPSGIFSDFSGNLLVCDTGHNRVVAWNGSSWSVAGFTGLSAPEGICRDYNTPLTLYCADSGNSRVVQLTAGLVQTTLTLAGAVLPTDCVSNNVGLYVSDQGHAPPRVTVWNGSSWSTVSVPGLGSPAGLAQTGTGSELFVADYTTPAAYHFLSGWATMPFSGVSNPHGICVDSGGNVYLVDTGNNRVVAIYKDAYTLGTEVLDQISALDHLNTCAFSCYSYLYVDRLGVLQFQARHAADLTSAVTFTDAGGPVRYQDIALQSSALLLYTEVTGVSSATDAGGVRQTATTPSSPYYVKVYQLPSLNNKNDADVQNLVEQIRDLYNEPEVRVDFISVELSSASGSDQTALCALDLTDVVTVDFHPPNADAIALAQLVEGITFDLNASAATYVMTLNCGTTGA